MMTKKLVLFISILIGITFLYVGFSGLKFQSDEGSAPQEQQKLLEQSTEEVSDSPLDNIAD